MISPNRCSRRDILTSAATGGTLIALGGLLPRAAYAAHAARAYMNAPALTRRRRPVSALDPIIVIDSTEVRALAMRALDAAKSAGAHYADVRLTRSLEQYFDGGGGQGGYPFSRENERLGIGVRIRINGGWGFAASPYWNSDDVIRLARDAARQASTNARVAAPPETWTAIPVASGHWSTPIQVDPFVVPVEEKGDAMQSWCALARRYRIENYCAFLALFTREERAVATTDGAYFTQTLYQSGGEFTFWRQTIYGEQKFGSASASGTNRAAAGWELFTEADIPSQIPALHAAADPERGNPPAKPGDVGRYDVVFDAASMGELLDRTIGVATQVDRALGYEANAGGTSYLGPDPLALLGTYQTAAPSVTITANRSMPRGVGTVKWDDEGVEPDTITLVKDGTLSDYQTTREQAMWLAPWYERSGKPARSHGCSAAESALSIPMQHMPNVVLEPGLQDITFDTMVSDTKRGLAVMGAQIDTDFQAKTGAGRASIREIVNGRLGAEITGLGFLFNTTQIWKNIITLGGAQTAMQYASGAKKGEPAQSAPHSVRAVPAKIKNVDFVDLRRRA